jgi:hypothetical protein
VCDLSHSYSVSCDALISTNGGGRATAASRLDTLGHRPCCLPTQAHDARRAITEEGYAWIYQRLFSHTSIWRRRRRPEDWHAVPLYLAMSYLYKRSNWLFHRLIKHELVHTVWSPLVHLTRLRHVMCGSDGRCLKADGWLAPRDRLFRRACKGSFSLHTKRPAYHRPAFTTRYGRKKLTLRVFVPLVLLLPFHEDLRMLLDLLTHSRMGAQELPQLWMTI